MTDWAAWHAPYDDRASPLSSRLAAVRDQVRHALDRAPDGPLRLLSLCAGQGVDVLPVLAEHPRGADARGRLVELDERNAVVARQCAPGATVVWPRSTHAPDLTPSVRRWFAQAGVVETAFVVARPGGWSVGAGTFTGEAQPPAAGERLFTFTTRPP